MKPCTDKHYSSIALTYLEGCHHPDLAVEESQESRVKFEDFAIGKQTRSKDTWVYQHHYWKGPTYTSKLGLASI